MRPAAVLAAIVKVQGLKTANAGLIGFQANLVKSDAASAAGYASASKYGRYLKGGLAAGAVAAAYALGKGAQAGANFNERLDTTQAVLKATDRQMEKVRKQAYHFGETSIYSANAAADAQRELAKGGLSLEQILKGGLRAALNLGAAGELEMAEAATITANTMKLFKIEGENAAEVADMIAIAANDTTAEVYDFGMALKQGGGVARLVGYDLKKTMTILEALAEAGVKNSDAGTSMKAAMIQLVTPSKEQREIAKEYSIDLIDQAGNMKSAVGISAEFRKELGDLNRQERAHVLATLAGTDGVRTLNALWEAGPEKLSKLEHKLETSGYAQEVASEKTDNLKGDLKKMLNAWEVVGIKLLTEVEPALRSVVQAVADAGTAVSNFDLSGTIDDIDEWISHNQDAQEVIGVWSNISEEVVGAAEFAVREATPFIEELLPIWETQGQAILDYVQGLWNVQLSAIKGDPSGIKDGLVEMFGAAFDYLKASGEGILVLLSPVGNLLAQIFGPAIDWIVGAAQWIDRAAGNVKGFIGALIPVQFAMMAIKVILAPLAISLGFLAIGIDHVIDVIGILIGHLEFFLIPAESMIRVLKVGVVVAFEIAIAIIKVMINYAINMGRVIGDVIGLVSNLLRGDWAGAWKNAKELVASVIHLILSLVRDLWNVTKTMFVGGMKVVKTVVVTGFDAVKDAFRIAADFIKDIFKASWDTVESLFEHGLNSVVDIINAVIGVLNKIPGVEIGLINGGGDLPGKTKMTKAEKRRGYDARAMGGKVTKPIAIMGEEAPRHHEWVIASNPAYRQKNLGYWAKAGADLGVPGFADGGLFGSGISVPHVDIPGPLDNAAKDAVMSAAGLVAKGAGFLIDQLPTPDIPEPMSGVGPWIIDQAKEYITGWFDKNEAKYAQSSGGVPGYSGPPADMKNLGDNAWVDSHTLAVAAYLASKFGISMSSGYRSPAHNAAVGGVPNSFHTHGSPSNPGAIDFVPPSNAALEFAQQHIAGLMEAMIHDVGSGLHLHLAFFKKGGFIDASDSQKEVALDIGKILLGKGLNYKGAAGIIGNAWRESLWDPASIGTGGRGLWGFDFYEQQLLEAANKQGVSWTNLPFQTEFMWSGPEPASNLKGALNSQPSAAAAAKLFDSEWERSGVKAMSDRMNGAREAMALMTGTDMGEVGLTDSEKDAIKKAKEEKKRKAAREDQLKKLKGAVGEVKTDPAKRSKLWQLVKFWGRSGLFDKDERSYILDKVKDISAKTDTGTQVKMLTNLSKYLENTGEITGRDPDDYHSLIDAMEKAQENGKKIREKTVDRQQKKKERIRNKKIASIEARGQFPGLTRQLEEYRKKTEEVEEYAGQLVTLEPENINDDYVGSEQRAYESALDQLGSWRNTIIGDYPKVDDRIFRMGVELNNIEVFKPRPNEVMKNEIAAKTYQKNKWRIAPLKKAIESAKQFRNETLPGEMSELSPQTPEGIISPVPRDPVAGVFGGRIFDMQNTIRELGLRELSPHGVVTPQQEAELEKEKEEALNWKKRYLILRSQQKVMAGAPSVKDFPGMALGGVWVGERGKELLFPPVGSRVVPHREATQAAREGQGSTVLVIEELTINEDGSVTVRTPDDEFEAQVKKVNRKQAKQATFGRTPGGTTDR